MPQNKLKVILERRSRISEMYLRGVAQFKIAEALGCSTAQVSKDLKKLAEGWQKSCDENMDVIKARELEKINKLEKEYYDAWIRSCEVKTKKSAKKKTGKTSGEEKEQTLTEEQQIGDPRFLEGVRWCITKREEIFGYGSAKKIDLTSKGEKVSAGSVVVLPSNGREIIETITNNDNGKEATQQG